MCLMDPLIYTMQATRLRPVNGTAKGHLTGLPNRDTASLDKRLGRNRLNSVTRLKFRIANLARLSLSSRFHAWLKLQRDTCAHNGY